MQKLKSNILNSKFYILNSRGGFTLSEIIIAISITLILIGALFIIYTNTQKVGKSGSQKVELTQNARIALDKISRELRETNEIATVLPPTNDDPENPPANEISFRDANYSKIRYINYYVSGNSLYRKVYHYFEGTFDQWVPYNTPGATYQLDEDLSIADQITEITFYGQGIIAIDLTAQSGSDKVNLSNQIKPRNL